jgi:hypothetical protein
VCEEERRKHERVMKRACVCDEKKGGMEEAKKRKGKKGNMGLCVNAKGEGKEKRKEGKREERERG